MEDIKITIKSDVSINDTKLSFEKDITLEQAGKIIEFIALTSKDMLTSKCPYRDCPQVHYSNCPIHAKQPK